MKDENKDESETIKTNGVPKAQLVTEAWRRCSNARAGEMKKGYYNFKIDKSTGQSQKIWIEDGRKIFKNSVDAFEIVLADDLDEEYKTAKEELRKKAEKCYNYWAYHIFTVTKTEQPGSGKFLYKKKYTGKVVMPDESTVVYDVDSRGQKVPIKWDLEYHNYWEEIVEIYSEIYKELIKLVSGKKRLNNFKE